MGAMMAKHRLDKRAKVFSEVSLNERDAKTESQDSLVDADGQEDCKELGDAVPDTDGQALEDGVEGQGEEEQEGPQGGIGGAIHAPSGDILRCCSFFINL